MMTDEEILARALATPSGYAACKLGINLHTTQEKVLNSIFKSNKTRTSFLCGNGVGKTSVVLVASILYAIEMRNAQVVSTSATYRQIKSQLIPNLKQYANHYPNWSFNENTITINGIDRYIGFSTDTAGRFQGYHEQPGKPLLILVDEAAGIADTIFQEIDRCQPTWLVIVGSPLGPEGVFYQIETNRSFHKHFNHFKLTQLECPWINKEDVDVMISKWGVDHPLVRSSVFAEFAINIDNAIISLASLDKCLKNPPESSITALSDLHVGIDFAAGGDSNCIVKVHGNKVEIMKVWKQKDTMTAAGEIKNILDDLKLHHGLRPSQVSGDASGLGLPIIHRLRELGWPINYFYGQEKPLDEHYKNKIAECWLEGAKKIVNCKIILPDNDELKMQLLSRKQRLNSSGKMELESKDDMRERGIESPDIADAMFIALSRCNTNGAPFIAKPVNMGLYRKPSFNFA